MSLMSFLKTSSVTEVKPTSGRSGATKQRNPPPTIVAIRVWKDGSIYPSLAAKDKFDLEYRKASIKTESTKPAKEGEAPKTRKIYEYPDGTGNGLDVIDSRRWNQVKADQGAMLFVGVVAKNAGKVDLFNTVAFDDDGNPKVSVMDQGTVTFGQQVLIPALEEVYGIKFNRAEVLDERKKVVAAAITDGVDFVDLAIFESIGEGGDSFNVTEKYSKPIIFAPKLITRGEDKGKDDYARRENMKIYGLAPASDVLEGYKTEAESGVTEAAGNGTVTASTTTETAAAVLN